MIPQKRRIKKAKFNGVSFFIEEDEMSSGRRIVTDTFPYLETHCTQDLGKSPTQWQIQGFVGGSRCKEDAKKLQDELEKPGVGILDHPYIGKNQKVRIESYRRLESNREWGIIGFWLQFVEAGSPAKLIQNDDKIQSPSFLNQAKDLILGISSRLEEVSQFLDEFSSSVDECLSPLVRLRESVGDVITSVVGLKEAGRSIGLEPKALLNSMVSAFHALTLYALSKRDSAVFVTLLTLSSTLTEKGENLDNDSFNTSSVSHHDPGEIQKVFHAFLISNLYTLVPLALESHPDLVSEFLNICDCHLRNSFLTADLVQNIRSQTQALFSTRKSPLTFQTPSDTNLLVLSQKLYRNVLQAESLQKINPHIDPAWIARGTLLNLLPNGRVRNTA